ncbi:HAMP domain-containing histidine kinase [Candidatus Thorarchaeota archaeon]|nr:MAG: HAMP domain-containing histidine kinase [Candidatus Thorarchaeota archaeon]
MPPDPQKKKYYDSIIVVVFVSLLGAMLGVVGSGYAWRVILVEHSAFWLTVLVVMLATTAGIVFTYSFVRYTQKPNLRSMIIMFLGVNVVLFAFAYLITHPSIALSSIATRDRNRTIVTGLGFLLTPGVLAGSLAGNAPVTRKRKRIIGLWGAILQPLYFVLLLASPYPLFKVTDPEGGLGGLTIVGLLLTLVVGGSATVALVRYVVEWYRTRNRIVLSSTLTLILWIGSFAIYTLLEDPQQIAEPLWVGGVFAGFLLLALGMILTSIIEPHRVLESVVEERTSELRAARRESDFYLRMWVHKMGNLLQGIVTYLELLSERGKRMDEQEPYQAAMALSNEATFFNRQVSKLSEIKSSKDAQLVPVVVHSYVLKGLDAVRQTFQEKPVSAQVDVEKDLMVEADAMLGVLFANVIIQAVRLASRTPAEIGISAAVADEVRLRIKSPGTTLSEADKRFLVGSDIPELSTLNIHLYTARVLADRYGGRIEYSRMIDEDANLFEIVLKRV